MAYTSDQTISGLEAITSVDNTDVLVAGDTSDSNRAKKITRANFVTDMASATQTLTNKTIDADGTGNSITNIEDANIKAAAAIDATKIGAGSVDNTELGYLNGVTSAIQTQIDSKIGAATTDTLTNKTFDANGLGNNLSNVDVADLANGTDGELITWDSLGAPATVATGTSGQVLTSNGAGAAPTFQAAAAGSPLTTKGDLFGYDTADARIPIGTNGQVLTADSAEVLGLKWSTPAGGGDVVKVGTPVNNQLGVWTGDGTIEGDAALTFDTTTDTLSIGASGKLAFGAVDILSDSAGTTTLSNIDAIDATTETTLEAAIDSLTNLTAVGTIATGTWQATAITDTYISSAATWNAKIANVVEDTTPQLGGMLDVNGNAIGDGTLELLKFTETVSAVNEFTVVNAATGNGPDLQATGDDTNIDLNLTPKGTGIVKGELKRFMVQLLDSATDQTVDTAIQGDFRISNRAITVKAVGAYVDTAGTTGTATIDINEAGTSILSTKITIDSTEKSSETAATPPVISDSLIAADGIITIDVDAIQTTAAKGLKVWIDYVYA